MPPSPLDWAKTEGNALRGDANDSAPQTEPLQKSQCLSNLSVPEGLLRKCSLSKSLPPKGKAREDP